LQTPPRLEIIKPRTPFCIYDGSTVFGSKYDMVMQAKIGGCHSKLRLNVVFLRPRRGRGFLSMPSGGVATLNPRLTA